MKLILLQTFKVLFVVYILICVILYFFQERLIFFPYELNKQFKFSFDQPFEEIYIKAKDGKLLHALLFTSESSKGLIFYLHGNAGSLEGWGGVAKTYTDLSYDVFILDYRGFGKSEGSISSQEQLFDDVQVAYSEMKKRYNEDKIIVLGYSIGTGPATKIASANQPKLLILQAPFYSLTDLMKYTYKIIPTFILKYKLETNKYIKACQMPVVIFHGDRDVVIYYYSSVKLQEIMKNRAILIILEEQGHNGMTDNPEYKKEIKNILSQ